MGWKKGFYKLENPDKYIGDPSRVIYRSSWEQVAFKICDNNPYVLEWAAELIKIPYLAPASPMNPKKMIQKFYIPDLYVVLQNEHGEVVKKIIEIKPLKQTRPSRARNPRTKLYEDFTYVINSLKWKAAENYCEARNIEFEIATEKNIFGNRHKRRKTL